MAQKAFIKAGIAEIQFGEKIPKDAVELDNWRFLSPLDVREIAYNLENRQLSQLDIDERNSLSEDDLKAERERLALVAKEEQDRLELEQMEKEEAEAAAKKLAASVDPKSANKNNAATKS
jgi:hypothetical protein